MRPRTTEAELHMRNTKDEDAPVQTDEAAEGTQSVFMFADNRALAQQLARDLRFADLPGDLVIPSASEEQLDQVLEELARLGYRYERASRPADTAGNNGHGVTVRLTEFD